MAGVVAITMASMLAIVVANDTTVLIGYSILFCAHMTNFFGYQDMWTVVYMYLLLGCDHTMFGEMTAYVAFWGYTITEM